MTLDHWLVFLLVLEVFGLERTSRMVLARGDKPLAVVILLAALASVLAVAYLLNGGFR